MTRLEDGNTTRKRADTKPPAEEHRQQPKDEQAGNMEPKEIGEKLTHQDIANARNTAYVDTI